MIPEESRGSFRGQMPLPELLDVRAAQKFIASSWCLMDFPCVLAGVSFGAATAIRFAATYPHDFRGVIAISGYADFPLMLREGVRKQYGLLGRIPGFSGMILKAIAYELAAQNLDELSPVLVVDRIAPTPLLIMQGTGDDIVGEHHAKTLFAHAKDPKSYALIGGGSHGFLLTPVASNEAARRAKAAALCFLDRVVNNHPPSQTGDYAIMEKLLTQAGVERILALKVSDC